MPPLSQIGQLRKGITRKRLEDPFGSAYGLYQIANLKSLSLEMPSETVYLDPIKIKDHALLPGDVLVSLIGVMPVAGVVPTLPIPAVANANVAVFRVNQQRVDPWYIAAVFRTSLIQTQLAEAITGSVIPNLSLAALAKTEVPIPNIEIQRAVANAYRSMEHLESSVLLALGHQRSLLEAESLAAIKDPQ